MIARPHIGSKITVVVKHNGYEPVFVPGTNSWTPRGPDTVTYCGTVVRPDDHLRADEFNLTTGLANFPIRTITLQRVVSIDGTVVDASVVKDVVEVVNVNGSKGNVYEVIVHNGVAEQCSCPGFMYHGGRCKHLQMATGRGDAPRVDLIVKS